MGFEGFPVRSPSGQRTIAFSDFHRLPGNAPQRDNTLAGNELIVHIELPANGLQEHSTYLKLRDRASCAFALVSVAAAFELDAAGLMRNARIALGGVAHKPWRDAEAEQLLEGQHPDAAAFHAAAHCFCGTPVVMVPRVDPVTTVSRSFWPGVPSCVRSRWRAMAN